MWSNILCNAHVQTAVLIVTNVTITSKVKMYLHIRMAILKIFGKTYYYVQIINKPAAQAAGADPSQCNSNDRHNPPIQQNPRTDISTNDDGLNQSIKK